MQEPYSENPSDPFHQVLQTSAQQDKATAENTPAEISEEASEVGAAEKSACVIVLVIFLILASTGGGVWYYLTRDKKPQKVQPATAPARIEEPQKDANLITAAAGGKVKACDEAEIIIPQGALEKDTKIEMQCVEKGNVTDLYRLKPDNLKFSKPVTIVIPYKKSGLFSGQTPYDIDLEYWFKEMGQKKLLRYTVDTQERKLRTQVREF